MLLAVAGLNDAVAAPPPSPEIQKIQQKPTNLKPQSGKSVLPINRHQPTPRANVLTVAPVSTANLNKPFDPITVKLIGGAFTEIIQGNGKTNGISLTADRISVMVNCGEGRWLRSATILSETGGSGSNVMFTSNDRVQMRLIEFTGGTATIANANLMKQRFAVGSLATVLVEPLIALKHTCEWVNPVTPGPLTLTSESTLPLGKYPITVNSDQRTSIAATAAHLYYMHKCPSGYEIEGHPGFPMFTNDSRSPPLTCKKR